MGELGPVCRCADRVHGNVIVAQSIFSPLWAVYVYYDNRSNHISTVFTLNVSMSSNKQPRMPKSR